MFSGSTRLEQLRMTAIRRQSDLALQVAAAASMRIDAFVACMPLKEPDDD